MTLLHLFSLGHRLKDLGIRALNTLSSSSDSSGCRFEMSISSYMYNTESYKTMPKPLEKTVSLISLNDMNCMTSYQIVQVVIVKDELAAVKNTVNKRS